MSAQPPLQEGDERDFVGVRLNDVLDGKWRLLKKLGEGGMGSVYLARDLALDRDVALKLLAPSLVGDAEVVARFEREARLTAALDHPNIVPVYAVGQHKGRPFIVMKKLEGNTLAELLREKGGLTLDETVALMKQLATGLDHIHTRGYVHRDIKASNIFVGPEGHATILDFGILRTGKPGEALTRTGVVMGTPHYMSPEQALGNREIDHRADLYALAVVLFECLTGTLPFQADSELKIIQMQAYAPPPDLLERAPWIPHPVAAVVQRAMAKRPEDRYPSARELVAALEVGARLSRAGQRASPASPILHTTTAPSWRMRGGGDEKPPPGPPAQPEPAAAASGSAATLGTTLQAVRRSRTPMLALAAVIGVAVGGGAFYGYLSSERVASSPGVSWRSVGEDAGERGPMTEDSGPARLTTTGLDGGGAFASLAEAEGELTEQPGEEPGQEPGLELEGIDLSQGAPSGAHGSDGGEARELRERKRPGRRTTTGRLRVIAVHKGEPYWAQVLVDGVDRGRSPLELELAEGRHQVRVVRTGFRAEERSIKVAPGRMAVLRIQLRP